jgi:hypothetical protein
MDGYLHQGDPFHWTAPVRDPFGRERVVRIAARANRVVLIVPPGEGFEVEPDEAEFLAAALRAASERSRWIPE